MIVTAQEVEPAGAESAGAGSAGAAESLAGGGSKFVGALEVSFILRTCASATRRDWMAGNLARDVCEWLQSLGVTQVALEELSFAQTHDTNRLWNRITHNFCTGLLFRRLVVALRKRGVAVFTVPATYTSLVGYFKYGAQYGLSAHQAAGPGLARRALGFREKVPRELARDLAPEEGCRHWRMWGTLYGMLKAGRRRAAEEDRLFRGWSARDWVSYLFAGSG